MPATSLDGRSEPVEIVLTGGPGSGKSSSLAILSQKLTDWGFRVLLAPEVATMLIAGGIPDIGAIAADRERFMVLESHFLAFQRALRERYQALATMFLERTVIIYDRGESDVAAYVDAGEWAQLLLRNGLTEADVRDSYDAVIHLVTAADGAEAFYTTANNTARRETLEEARALDARTLAAWVGHPHLRVIDNSTGFDEKMRRTVAAIARVLGIPEPLEIERKWLLANGPAPATLAALGANAIPIEQTYLRSDDPDISVRVRRRGAGRNAMYYQTTKQRISAQKRVETESVISRRAYEAALAEADPERRAVRKMRHCFVWHGTYFELDQMLEPADLWLLEAELGEEGEQIELPPALDIAREVTDEPGWTNADLARIED